MSSHGKPSAANLASAEHIRNNPKFRELVAKRNAFAWTLSAIMLIIYFGFIAVTAFNRAWLGTRVSLTLNLSAASTPSAMLKSAKG
jgi:uncharacterized membrane protein (DUF485 family)